MNTRHDKHSNSPAAAGIRGQNSCVCSRRANRIPLTGRRGGAKRIFRSRACFPRKNCKSEHTTPHARPASGARSRLNGLNRRRRAAPDRLDRSGIQGGPTASFFSFNQRQRAPLSPCVEDPIRIGPFVRRDGICDFRAFIPSPGASDSRRRRRQECAG